MTAPIVSSLKWSGGSLPDTDYADFPVSAVLPEAAGLVTFPTVQTVVTPRWPGSRSRLPARTLRRWSIRHLR